jgi:flagellar basal-body rod modification protein FlgD
MTSSYLSTSDVISQYSKQQNNVQKQVTQDATAKLSQDYSTFLTMLTTQLQNQDPLSPMDSSQFTQQLVAFSSVEQQISANQKLDELISVQKLGGATTVLGYIGKEVEVPGNRTRLVGDDAKFSYTMSDTSEKVTITIRDKSGQIVRTMDGNKSLGRHEVVWDGKNDGGIELPKGTYAMYVTSTTSDGTTVNVPTSTIGTVTAIETTPTGAVLSINGLQVDAAYITAIRTPGVES